MGRSESTKCVFANRSTMHPSLPQCPAARALLESAGDLKRKWTWAVEWLHDELERGGGHRSADAVFWTSL